MARIKSRRKTMPPGLMMSWLESTEGIQAMHVAVRYEQIRRLRRERRCLEREVPSATWMEAVWERGEKLPRGWIVCRGCGRHTPANYIISTGHCYDCQIAGMTYSQIMHLPSSPSGIAIAAAAAMGVRIV